MKKIIISICMILAFAIHSHADEGLTNWHGIASKNHILRLMHDDKNLYVSSSNAGITVIEKSKGGQKTLNRANEKSFDNMILDMNMYADQLWTSGRFYGFGNLSDAGYTKFDMLHAGCVSTQWMQGILVEDPSKILLGGLLAFYQFNGTECIYTYLFNELSPMAMVTDIKKTADGSIFVSCIDWGANGESLFQFTSGKLIPIDNPCRFINRMSVDGNILWLASDGDGLVKYEKGAFTQYTSFNSELPNNYLVDISTDVKGEVWAATNTHIVKFSEGKFYSYAMPDSFADKGDRFTAIDADGSNVYVGTQYHGLLKLTDNSFTTIEMIDNPDFCNTTPNILWSSSSMDSEGNFLMVSSDGLNIYNPENCTSRIIRYSDLREVCVSPLNGDIWLRRDNPDSCLVRTGNERLTFSMDLVPFSTSEIGDKMIFDNNGILWVVVEDGLMRYDGNSWKHFTQKDAGFPLKHIICMAVDSKNRLWCGTFGENRIGNGLIMYDGANWHNYKTSNSSIPSDFVGAINIDNDDVVWMNCRHEIYPEVDMYGYGLTSFDGEKWRTYNTSNSGMCSDHIYSIGIDKDNTKWLATAGDNGITSFDGKNWQLYNVDNSGIALNTTLDITIDIKNDLIWFVHMLNAGVSYAKLNTDYGGIEEITDNYADSIIEGPVSIYNLQGYKVYSSSDYQRVPTNLRPGVYIVVTQKRSRKMYLE